MIASQFLRLMRDCELLGPNSRMTGADLNIIYTSESRGRADSSGRMTFDEFLNALMAVATRLCVEQVSRPQGLQGLQGLLVTLRLVLPFS